ncbi:MAG: sugar-transfer associated ATP-grasp domain-containing protein [Acidobacteriota bacterium]
MREPRLLSFWGGGTDILGLNARNLQYVHALNPRRFFPLADDKIRTKAVLSKAGVPHPKTMAVFANLAEISRARPALTSAGEFVVKPARGRRGSGILVIARADEDGFHSPGGDSMSWMSLRRAMGDILFGVHSVGHDDRVLVEQRVHPDPDLGGLSTCGLPDVRVLLLHQAPVMAMMRVPTRASGGRANLHQGAPGIAIRLDDGHAFRCLASGEPLTHHPDTSAPMVGFDVPRWPDILHAARRAAASLPLPYLGVDIVVDRNAGPLVMEVNVRPGLEIQNINGAGLRARLAAIRCDEEPA